MPEMSLDSVSALNEAQQALARRLVGGALPARVLLLAPTGAGKTHLATTVARELLERESQTQVLFIVSHRVVAAAYDEALPARHLDLFSRSALRDLQASSDVPFAGPVAVFVNREALAAREMQGALSESFWDLVVVDEAHNFSDATRTLVRRLVDKHGVDRLLLLSQGDGDAPAAQYARELPEVDVEQWRLPRLERFAHVDTANALPPMTVVAFTRSEPERAVLTQITQLEDELAGWVEPALLEHVRKATESSFYALEQELLVLLDIVRRRRNVLAHHRTSSDEHRPPESAHELIALVQVLPQLERLVDQFDALTGDSKTSVFTELLSRLQSEDHRRAVCVFVDSAATGTYLYSALREAPTSTLLVTEEQRTPSYEVERVAANNGVLVVVDEALPAYNLRAFKVGIHYDLPAKTDGWSDRFARLDWLEHSDEVMTYALVDAERLARDPNLRDLSELNRGSLGLKRRGPRSPRTPQARW